MARPPRAPGRARDERAWEVARARGVGVDRVLECVAQDPALEVQLAPEAVVLEHGLDRPCATVQALPRVSPSARAVAGTSGAVSVRTRTGLAAL